MEVRVDRHSLSLSVLAHLMAFSLAILLAGKHEITPPELPPILVEIEKPLDPQDQSRQVVQSNQGEKTDKAAPHAFLGQETRVVDRETTAKSQVVAPKAGGALAQPQSQSRDKAPLARFGVPILPAAEKPSQVPTPQWVDFTGMYGAAGADYVKGLKESEQSALNTREFAYYSYFQRIRLQLDHAWQKLLKENVVKLYRAGRSLASDMDHTTKTVVSLNGKGEVIRIQVLEESGTRDLDDAAVQAFNKAGPFPNPPREMVDSQGIIRIRWDFILKT